MPLRTLLVDDEPLARQRLRLMLADHADVEIIGECVDAGEALRTIQAMRPELVMLDVQMPGADGFSVMSALSLVPRPFVVFVTAHAEHAARAFDVDAVDYLLKPYDEERLARSIEKARRALAARSTEILATEVRALTEALQSGERRDARARPAHLDRFAVTVGRRTMFVTVDEIDWIESDRNYVHLHAGDKHHLVRATIAALEAALDPTRFVRVHRSAIVRRDRVRELRQLATGEWRAVMATGAVVPVSPRYREKLL
jgi:two-component system LytT family response regulator